MQFFENLAKSEESVKKGSEETLRNCGRNFDKILLKLGRNFSVILKKFWKSFINFEKMEVVVLTDIGIFIENLTNFKKSLEETLRVDKKILTQFY